LPLAIVLSEINVVDDAGRALVGDSKGDGRGKEGVVMK